MPSAVVSAARGPPSNWKSAPVTCDESPATTYATSTTLPVMTAFGAGCVTVSFGGLLTVTEIAPDVAVLAAMSRAVALIAYVPLASVAVFQEIEYGPVESSAPRALPFSRNCTPATPTLSDA